MKKKEFDNDGEDDIIYKDLDEDGGLILLLIIKYKYKYWFKWWLR